ncbi:ppg3 [Cystoisospora suis]|uniref:Ppg3 n=1 Tax=Cystoisospora suis TaxID=483139 RepID=A0A2C6KUN8_9APIC|nr:ppg3 [Cystoisospora suis]
MRMNADSDQGSTSLYAGAMSCGKASSISSMPAELVPEAPDPQAVRGLFKLIEEPLLAIRTTSTQVGAGGLAAGLSAVSVASWNLLDRLVSVHDQAGDAQFRF